MSARCTDEKACENCRYSEKLGTHDNYDCRRHAPVMEKVKSYFDLREYLPRWPIVKSTDWCGDFERKPRPPRPFKERLREFVRKPNEHGSWY